MHSSLKISFAHFIKKAIIRIYHYKIRIIHVRFNVFPSCRLMLHVLIVLWNKASPRATNENPAKLLKWSSANSFIPRSPEGITSLFPLIFRRILVVTVLRHWPNPFYRSHFRACLITFIFEFNPCIPSCGNIV
jgi:hypothetical protein